MVASHLLKFCHFYSDIEGHKMELRYIRDETGKECDFVVIKDKKPVFAVECKLSSTVLDKNLNYFKSRISIPKWYQVTLEDIKERRLDPNLSLLSFHDFCLKENLV